MPETDPLDHIVCSEDGDIFWGPKRVWPKWGDFVEFVLDNGGILSGDTIQLLDVLEELPCPWDREYSKALWRALRKRTRSVAMRPDKGNEGDHIECSRRAKDAEPYWKLDLESAHA